MPVLLKRLFERPVDVVSICRSIFDRRNIEDRLAEECRLAELTSQVGIALAESGTKPEMLRRVCEAFVDRTDAFIARIWTIDGDDCTLRLRATVGLEVEMDGSSLAVPIGAGGVGSIVSTKETYFTNDICGDATLAVSSAASSRINAFVGFPLEAAGDVVGVLGLYRAQEFPKRSLDAFSAISKFVAGSIARHRLQRQRDLVEQRYRMMMEQVSDYAIFLIDLDGRITTWHEGVRNVLGYEESEFIGSDVVPTIFTAEAIQDGVPEWEFATARESGSCTDDRWMRRKDGTTFWASGITTALEDSNGKITGYNKIMRDLTHRKDAEDAIRELNAELSASDRQKNQFLATLAHELRNPLSPITSAIELMRDIEGAPADLEQLRALVERQVKQMVCLVDGLLDLSRISRGKIDLKCVDCRLQPVIQQAIEAAQPFIAQSSHVLRLKMPEEPIHIYGDPVRLSQVVNNLLNNSAKYTPTDGEIELLVESIDKSVRICVRDNGIGIEPDRMATVFDMFAQADASLERGKSGLGIGLSLVRTLVTLHDGTIDVFSDGRNKGTEVIVTLPVIDRTSVDRRDLRNGNRDQPTPELTATTGVSIAQPQRRVLVVDDVHAITFTLSRLIGKLGHVVTTAASGQEALDQVNKFNPGVIFSDISMPKMNGYELAAEVRSRFPDRGILMVAMTGFGQEADRCRALKAGFDHHMVKPPDAGELANLFTSFGS